MSSHHDALFHLALAHDDDLVESLEVLLGPEVWTLVDPTSMKRLPTVLHDPDDGELRSDLVVSLTAMDQQVVLRIVYEHQSHPNLSLPLRTLGYARRTLMEHARSEERDRPAVAMVIVLTHDASEWSRSMSLVPDALREHPLLQALEDYVIDVKPLVIDLANPPPGVLERPATPALAFSLLAASGSGRVWEVFRDRLELVAASLRARGRSVMSAFLRYTAHVDRRPPGAEVLTAVKAQLPNVSQEMKSWAQQLEERGEAQGRQKHEAEVQVQTRALLRQTLAHHSLEASHQDAIDRADLNTLLQWLARAAASTDPSFLLE